MRTPVGLTIDAMHSDSPVGQSWGLWTAAPCPCVVAEAVESFREPLGGPCGLSTPPGASTPWLPILRTPAEGTCPCVEEDKVGSLDSPLGWSCALRTGAQCPCATAEDVESLGSPLGCLCGVRCCVYARRTPASSMRATNSFSITRPPSSLHGLSITRTAACRRPGGFFGTFGPKGVERINRSVQSYMGTAGYLRSGALVCTLPLGCPHSMVRCVALVALGMQ